jgi:hypothetical protein
MQILLSDDWARNRVRDEVADDCIVEAGFLPESTGNLVTTLEDQNKHVEDGEHVAQSARRKDICSK